jgi:ABC-2 type transport system ATP-binding protein
VAVADAVPAELAKDVAVDVRELTKRYGALTAVAGVSLTVMRGEFFGILGPNGAGKTTTLEMLEGLREPDSGTVTLLGEAPWPRNSRLLPRIGVQLQSSAFFDKLSAREQLQTFGALYGIGRNRVDGMLDLVGLTDKATTREDKLSGGQRQRLSIACALIHDPELVFLDEPTAALDPQARRNLWDVLRDIQSRGTTVVYTTHYLDEAEILCDRVAIMDAGRILTMGSPATLIRSVSADTRISLPTGNLTTAEARELPGADSVRLAEGELVITTATPSVLLHHLATQGKLDGISVRTATLEDVFLQLTGREYRS